VHSAGLLGLIVLGLAWELWLAPTGNRTLALKVLPLALPLAGLLKRRLYTYRWVSLLVWLYFIEGRGAGHRRPRPVGATGWMMAEVLLCLSLFAACAAHVRWRLAHRGGIEAARGRHCTTALRGHCCAAVRAAAHVLTDGDLVGLRDRLAQALPRPGLAVVRPASTSRGGRGGARLCRDGRSDRAAGRQHRPGGRRSVPDGSGTQVLLSLGA
jgi:uncharacterized membrane protein